MVVHTREVCIHTFPQSLPDLFIARKYSLSTPLIATIPTATVRISRIPAKAHSKGCKMVVCSPLNLEGLVKLILCNTSVFIENLQHSFLKKQKSYVFIHVKKGLDFKKYLYVIMSAYSHSKSCMVIIFKYILKLRCQYK